MFDHTLHDCSAPSLRLHPTAKKVAVLPRVTFVIPCFNDDPAHMAEAVQSVLSQQGVDIELVIVNDGSTRRSTLEYLQELASKGFHVIDTPNRGPAAARNEGISACTADFILPVDADDYISERCAINAVATLADPSVEIAYPTAAFIGQEATPVTPRGDVHLIDILPRNQIPVTALFRRSTWECLGGYDESVGIGYEDWEWWCRILLRRGVARHVEDARLSIRKRADSKSNTTDVASAFARTREIIAWNSRDSPWLLAGELWTLVDSMSAELRAWERRFGRISSIYDHAPVLQTVYRRTFTSFRWVRRLLRRHPSS